MKTLCFFALIAFFAANAKANTIDFETQGASAPNAFDANLNSPLTIGIAIFTGGKLLRNEAGVIDITAVYATTNLIAGPYVNPLTITFSQPVSNVSLLLTNNIPDTYTLADNRGGTTSAAVNFNATQAFSLTDSGVTSVTIAAATAALFDFAIDNVTFTPATVMVAPEPVLLVPVGAFLLAVTSFVRRNRALNGADHMVCAAIDQSTK